MIHVVFVCLGNICRSPMAEAVFAERVRLAELSDQITCDSAGTGQWHVGERPHHGTRRVLDANGVPCDHHARLLLKDDLEEADYVIAMDLANMRDIQALGPAKAHVALFLDYAPHTGVREVPDPYYTGRFEEVYDLVAAAADGLLAAIRKEHGL